MYALQQAKMEYLVRDFFCYYAHMDIALSRVSG